MTRTLCVGGGFNCRPSEEVFMSLQALCGEPSVDAHIRKVANAAHNVASRGSTVWLATPSIVYTIMCAQW